MWLRVKGYTCEKQVDEKTRQFFAGKEQGARWKRENGIQSVPSAFQFWLEFKSLVEQEKALDFIFEKLKAGFLSGVPNYITGYIGKSGGI